MNNPTIKSVPHSIEAERIVLGAMLLDAGACKRYASELIAEMFYWKPHATIFDVIRDMLARGQPIEPPALTQELVNRNLLEQVGGAAAVADLFLAVPTAATADHYAGVVTEMHMRRLILDTAHQAQALAYDLDHEPSLSADALRQAYASICSFNALRTCADLKPLADYEGDYRKFVHDAVSGRSTSIDLSQWMPALRNCGGGRVMGGELITLMADTGVGKTAVASSMALAAAPSRVAYFQLELPSNLAFPRFLQTTHGQRLTDVFDAYRHGHGMGWGKDERLSHIWLSVRAGLSIRRIQQRVEALNATMDRPFDLVIVDYFQLLRGQGKTRYERFSNEAEDAKIAAKETNAAWVLISQVARPEKKDEAPRSPTLHDAKESGSIENSSGLMIALSREGDDENAEIAFRVVKSTKGGAGTCWRAQWDLKTLRMTPCPR